MFSTSLWSISLESAMSSFKDWKYMFYFFSCGRNAGFCLNAGNGSEMCRSLHTTTGKKGIQNTWFSFLIYDGWNSLKVNRLICLLPTPPICFVVNEELEGKAICMEIREDWEEGLPYLISKRGFGEDCLAQHQCFCFWPHILGSLMFLCYVFFF